jgi:hypothetical protein
LLHLRHSNLVANEEIAFEPHNTTTTTTTCLLLTKNPT